jgi:hypothetical protein
LDTKGSKKNKGKLANGKAELDEETHTSPVLKLKERMDEDFVYGDAGALGAEHSTKEVERSAAEGQHSATALKVLNEATRRDEAVRDLAAVSDVKGLVADNHTVEHHTQ